MSERWIVSPYALVHWVGGRPHVAATSYCGASTYDIALVLRAFASPRALDEVVDDQELPSVLVRAGLLDELIRDGLLIRESEQDAASRSHWDPLAWGYHRLSRQWNPCRNQKQVAPADAFSRVTQAIPLPRLTSPPRAADLFELLDARKSTREWSPDPIGFETLSQFLWFCARDRMTRATLKDAREIELGDAPNGDGRAHGASISRSYPSGGGAYTLELFPVIGPAAVETLPPGIYRYLPNCHQLEVISSACDEAVRFLALFGEGVGAMRPPPVGFIVASQFARQSDVYGALAYSLVLKEVGTLLQTAYLVGAALGLGVCALGAGTPTRRFEALRGTSGAEEPVVGEFVVGRFWNGVTRP